MESKYNLKNLMGEVRNAQMEVKEIGDIAEKLIGGDSKITKSSGEVGEFGGIVCSDIFETKTTIDGCKIFINYEPKNKQVFAEKGDLIIARSGYTKKNKNGCRLFLGESKALAGNNIYLLKHSQNSKYLVNALSTESFNKQLKSFLKASLSSIMTVDLSNLKKIKAPIPSMEIQQKVADFLFWFTEYDKSLNLEIQKRRKQFHYFKEEIFQSVIEKCQLRNVN